MELEGLLMLRHKKQKEATTASCAWCRAGTAGSVAVCSRVFLLDDEHFTGEL